MAITRRHLLTRATALSVSVAISACADDDAEGGGTEGGTGDDGLPRYEYDGEPGPEDLFQHGVASGDPLADAVILWTRVTTGADAEVFFEVALDSEFSMRVAADYTMATSARDYTVKIDVVGLDPGTTYFYRFFSLGRTSAIGRTRTAPAGPIERLRIGVCSCSSLAHGYFHAYRRMAERADLDVVIHLGDYIYEYGNAEYGEIRQYEPATEIVSLADYRMRYAQYRRDADLQELHRQHPMVVVWDDHESANNSWRDGAENHSADEGDWATRKAEAEQAFREWLPIRDGTPGIIYRSFTFGDLMSIAMLDTRIVGRDEQAMTVQDTDVIEDPARHMLGAQQEAWLEQELGTFTSTWTFLGQQVMLAHMRLPGDLPLNADQWDGYEAARTRLFDIAQNTSPTNLVVLTGDIHSSWALDLARDPYGADYDPQTGAGALGVEFVAPAVTSPGFEGVLANLVANLPAENPHLRWADGVERGYILIDVTAQRVQASWFHIADVETPQGGAETAAAVYAVYDGANHLVAEGAPAEPPDAPPLAP